MTRPLQDCDIRSSMTMRRFGHAKKAILHHRLLVVRLKLYVNIYHEIICQHMYRCIYAFHRTTCHRTLHTDNHVYLLYAYAYVNN